MLACCLTVLKKKNTLLFEALGFVGFVLDQSDLCLSPMIADDTVFLWHVCGIVKNAYGVEDEATPMPCRRKAWDGKQ